MIAPQLGADDCVAQPSDRDRLPDEVRRGGPRGVDGLRIRVERPAGQRPVQQERQRPGQPPGMLGARLLRIAAAYEAASDWKLRSPIP